MKRLHVLALDGAMRSSVAITLDVAETANRIRCASGRPGVFDVTVSECVPGQPGAPAADVIVVPGLGMTSENELDERLRRSDAVYAAQALGDAANAGIQLAASCSSVFLLAQAQVLAGRTATTSWWLGPLFRRRYPDVTLVADEMVVVDGPVTTAGAAMAQLDLMLNLVGRHGGADLAQRCGRLLLLDERRSQSRYMALEYVTGADSDVARARSWALRRLADRPSVADIAAAVGLSPRTFARRVQDATGLSPVRFVRRLRVERAAELLETTDMPVDAVARAVGYLDPTALRRAMQQELEVGPQALRAARRPRRLA